VKCPSIFKQTKWTIRPLSSRELGHNFEVQSPVWSNLGQELTKDAPLPLTKSAPGRVLEQGLNMTGQSHDSGCTCAPVRQELVMRGVPRGIRMHDACSEREKKGEREEILLKRF